MPRAQVVAVLAEGQRATQSGRNDGRGGFGGMTEVTMNPIDGKMTRIRTGYRKRTWRYIGSHP
jgi:hypothetical protein